MKTSNPSVSSVWLCGGVVATLVTLGAMLGGGCFTTAELSCENNSDCFPEQICGEDGTCREGPNASGSGSGGDAEGGDGGDCVDTESTCYDGEDNDCDGEADCEDDDCMGNPCGKASEDGAGATCRSAGTDTVECRELDCCNCVDDDGDEIADYGVVPKPDSDAALVEQECQQGNCDGATVKEECDCTFDPDETDDIDTDQSRAVGVCPEQATTPEGGCARPEHFEDPEMTNDGKDNDCDGLTDEKANDTPGNRCGDDGDCSSGVCEPEGGEDDAARTVCAHRIFVTSGVMEGNLGGLEDADSLCINDAESAGLGGTWRAVLSAPDNNAKDRIDVRAPVIRTSPDRDRVADGASELWSDSHQNPINFGPGETRVGGDNTPNTTVWTGTAADGTAGKEHCENWTSSAVAPTSGTVGDATAQDTDWAIKGTQGCDQPARLYCIDGQDSK